MDYILYEQNGNVATITINREKALNALNSQVLDELNATLDAVDLATVRCLVITGAGSKSFVAGADIGEMSSLTKAEGEAFGKKGNDVFRKIETFPIPVIAAVNGFALGGGCEISMSCDIRICSDNAVFGQPEVGLGITPGFGGTQRLAHGKTDDLHRTQYQGSRRLQNRSGKRSLQRRSRCRRQCGKECTGSNAGSSTEDGSHHCKECSHRSPQLQEGY